MVKDFSGAFASFLKCVVPIHQETEGSKFFKIVSSCVPRKKESPTGLEGHEGEQMTEFLFLAALFIQDIFNYSLKTSLF